MNIIWKQPNGNLAFTTLAADCAESPEEHAVTLKSRGDIPQGFVFVGVNIAVPEHEGFFGSLVYNGSAIVHDMARARDIHRDKVRRDRAPLLAALDVEYQRADEAGDAAAKADVVRRKQVLRDATRHPSIEGAQSIDALRAL